jgi:hypothetical protein
MVSVSLTDREAELLKMSINHCLETCAQGGNGCTDCEALKEILKKL